MKTYNGFYGHTYFYVNGVLWAMPTNADGTADTDEYELYGLPVEEFAEPLTKKQLKIVKENLSNNL